ncbi:sigma-70 family RNA polymerase sigma factor [Mucilaginibacter sp. 14171R-50]|uniref:RNA polymerase sigma factor n=1 Tax=Mucilaginibacter sp. 14171R-50 TaxID=2703789 RepID=UPI00138DBD92|nr:sigma-70 family RNA polymerase sigma factor [Mucilaginibacter sp. 14171R-50]QHS55906.1 sigma-70 family RNA polymerase sigma factor [Mucilaginibacter sp. 14171R-50]
MDLDNENLKLLIQQLQQGSERAFTVLYDQFSQPIYRNILRLVKDEDIAQELLQDLFLKIWEIRKNIKQEGSFKSFLNKVAENMVYMHFRKIAKDNRLIEKLVISYADYETNNEESNLSEENLDFLQIAIGTLPPQRKQIYTLCKLEGKSYEEVSNLLGISTSTISNQIVKANKTVKQHFLLNKNIIVLFILEQLLTHRK